MASIFYEEQVILFSQIKTGEQEEEEREQIQGEESNLEKKNRTFLTSLFLPFYFTFKLHSKTTFPSLSPPPLPLPSTPSYHPQSLHLPINLVMGVECFADPLPGVP